MDGNVATVAEVDLYMAHDAMIPVHSRCVVEHVLQYHAVSRPEVGLQLRIGHDVEKRKKSI
jgi:hypothetical protein